MRMLLIFSLPSSRVGLLNLPARHPSFGRRSLCPNFLPAAETNWTFTALMSSTTLRLERKYSEQHFKKYYHANDNVALPAI